jgi:hypothetical protein
MCCRLWLLIALASLVTLAGVARTAEEDLKADLAVLRAGGMSTDSKDLLAFFRKRTVSEAMRVKVAALIRQLGSDEYEERQKAQSDLVDIGAPARPQLRDALDNRDLEIRRRARWALDKIGTASSEANLLAAGARVLAGRKAAGACEVLLDFLPSIEEPDTADDVARVLSRLALGKDDKPDPVLLKALSDRHPIKRWAAAVALDRAAGKTHRAAVRKLLKDDNPGVRRRVALSLIEGQDKEGVPALIGLLGSSSADADAAEQVLLSIAGDKAPTPPDDTDNPAARQRYRKAWADWWKDNGDSLDLAKVDFSDMGRGLTVLGVLGTNRIKGGVVRAGGGVYVMDNAGKVLWQIDGVTYPISGCMTRRDRVLVCEYSLNRVSEWDSKGRMVWKKELTTQPMHAQRLSNGHTFIVTRNQLLEVDRSGAVRKSINRPFTDLMMGVRHKDGTFTVLTTGGQCLRLDSTGKQTGSFAITATFIIGMKVEFLPRGGIVVPDYSRSKVREYDSTGRVVREFDSLRPSAVVKLPNGHYLVCSRSHNSIYEYDREGKQVNTRSVPGGTRGTLFIERK